MEKIFSLIITLIILCITPINSISEQWRDYSACKYGRLQSPISLNEYESTYSNSFSFVYQYYKNNKINTTNNSYTIMWTIPEGNFVNFEKEGVIKQYELKRIELYNGIHEIDGKKGDYELHLVHEKNLDFNSNKNQYRKIVDANMYLTIVLRYKKDCDKTTFICISDNGLLSKLKINESTINNFDLSNYPIYQDKRAYLYEGSFLYMPCDENVNYYVVNDFFSLENNEFNVTDNEFNGFNVTIGQMERYDRPVLKNFMNYREFLGSKFYEINIYSLFFMLVLFFL
jgi:carbonic anhydrase